MSAATTTTSTTTSGTMYHLDEPTSKTLHPGFSRITEGHATVFFAPPKIDAKKNVVEDIDDAAASASATSGKKQQQQQKKNQQQQQKKSNASSSTNVDTEDAEDDATRGDISVFYNPPQVVNRDLSVCVLQVFANDRPNEAPRRGGLASPDLGITVLEALSASGLRSVRFWHEVKGIRTIVANDLDGDAVECIRRNVESNNIKTVSPSEFAEAEASLRSIRSSMRNNNNKNNSEEVSEEERKANEEVEQKKQEAILKSSGIVPNRDDAIVLMQRAGWDPQLYPQGEFFRKSSETEKLEPLLHSVLFDCIDLDPYGTVGPFLDSTFDACKEGALISATSTDSAILCGNFPETCLAKYASTGIKTDGCHEMAPRLVLAALERAANRRGKFIEPLLSLHIDFYVRVFIRVYTQPAEVKLSMCKLGLQVQCSRCPYYHTQPLGHVPSRRGGDKSADSVNSGSNNFKKQNRQEKNQQKNKGTQYPGAKNATTSTAAAASSVNVSESTNDSNKNNNNANKQEQNEKSLPTSSSSSFCKPQTFPVFPDRSQNLSNFHVTAFTDNFPANPSLLSQEEEEEQQQQQQQNQNSGDNSARCPCCNGRLLVGGPLYCAPMHNHQFLDKLQTEIERRGSQELKGFNRIRGLVVTAREELQNVPLFIRLCSVASELKMTCPPLLDISRALFRLGFRVSSVHCDGAGVKTDCPMRVLMGVLLQHKKIYGHQGKGGGNKNETQQQQEKQEKQTEDKATTKTTNEKSLVPEKYQVTNLVPLQIADFSEMNKEEWQEFKQSQSSGSSHSRHMAGGSNNSSYVARFVQNAPGWGPRARHTGTDAADAATTTTTGKEGEENGTRRERED